MLRIDPDTQRDRMAEALDVILRFFKGDIVTEKNKPRHNFVGARAHILPYTKPHPEVAVVMRGHTLRRTARGQAWPEHDLVSPATNPFGYDALGANWKIANGYRRRARPDDGSGRIVPWSVHKRAETRVQAMEKCEAYGFEIANLGYLNNNQPRFHRTARPRERRRGSCGKQVRRHRHARVDAIALIQRHYDKQGEFGAFLQQVHNWADFFEQTKRSLRTVSTAYVMPHFSGDNRPRARVVQLVLRPSRRTHGKAFQRRAA